MPHSELELLARRADDGDLAAGERLLIEAARRHDGDLARRARRGVAELRWPGCRFVGLNAQGVREFLHVRTGLTLVEIPEGPFTMGRDAGHEDEQPAHQVTLSTFLIGKVPVPQAVFWRFTQAAPEYSPTQLAKRQGARRGRAYGWKDDRPETTALLEPIHTLTWEMAQAFCGWAGLRLPTEAQWEKAARGPEGAESPPGTPLDADYLTRQGEVAERRVMLAREPLWHPREPLSTELDAMLNGYGCLAMGWGHFAHWEWCADWYDERAYHAHKGPDPCGFDSGERRVLRGAGPLLTRRIPTRAEAWASFYTMRVVSLGDDERLKALADDGSEATQHFFDRLCHELDGFDASLIPKPLDAEDLGPHHARAAIYRSMVAALETSAGTPASAQELELAGVVVAAAAESAPAPLTKASAAELGAALDHLSPLALSAHFPRDEKGRLELETEVLLWPLETESALRSRGHSLWLVARSPKRRRDPQVLTVELATMNAEQRSHIWSAHRYRWDARHRGASAAARWGIDLRIERLGLAGREGALRALWADFEAAPQSLTDQARAELCVLLQDAGRCYDALQVYGIAASDELHDLLDAKPISTLHKRFLADWTRAVHAAVRGAALWRFAALLDDEDARVQAWVAEKKGRKKKPALLTLAILPRQTVTRKVRLMLTRTESGAALLDLVETGSDARLPLAQWTRPFEVDVLRFGLGKTQG